MIVYCTSKNQGPSYTSDEVYVKYLGTSIKEAEKAVGDFSRYQKEEDKFPKQFIEVYSAIPRRLVDWEMIQFYTADGWWYSIVMFDLQEGAHNG